MGRIITFDEYLETEYRKRVDDVRNSPTQWGREPLTDEEIMARTLSLDQFLEEINVLIALSKKSDPISEQDLPPHAKAERVTRPLAEGVKYANLNTFGRASDILIGDSSNYGIAIIAPPTEQDLFRTMDNEFMGNEHLRRNYSRDKETNVFNANIGQDERMKAILVETIYREFHRKPDRSAPIWKEIEGVHWSKITREQNIEREYQQRINPEGSLRLSHRDDYPTNRVTVSHAGNYPSVAEAIQFIAQYAREHGYMIHFNADIKPSFEHPGVLFDPRRDK